MHLVNLQKVRRRETGAGGAILGGERPRRPKEDLKENRRCGSFRRGFLFAVRFCWLHSVFPRCAPLEDSRGGGELIASVLWRFAL